MGLVSSKSSPTKLPDPSLMFSAAGILFTNETHVLAGFQPHKTTPCITGIGGSTKEGETALQSAWRETIEELFDCESVPVDFIVECKTKLAPRCWFSRGDYICFHYSFEDLKVFLNLAKKRRVPTSVYSSYPTTLLELIMNRKHSETSEVASLCLLPFMREANGPLFVHEEFCMDMEQLSFHRTANI